MTADLDDAPDAALAALGGRCPGWLTWPGCRRGRSGDEALAGAVAGLDQVRAARVGAAYGWPRKRARADYPARRGHARLEHWIREQTPTTSPRVAAAQARRAERLFTSAVAADLAPTRDALLTGQVSAEQADVVARTVQGLVPPIVPAGAVPDGPWSRAKRSCSAGPGLRAAH